MTAASRSAFLAGLAAAGAIRPQSARAAISPRIEIDNGPGAIDSVEFAPDGRHFVVASSSGIGNVYTAGGQHVARLAGHLGQMFSAHFNQTSTRIATAGYDGMVCVWTLSGTRTMRLHVRSAAATEARFTPANDGLIVSSDDGSTRRIDFDLHTRWAIARPGVARHVALSSDDALIASTSDAGILSLVTLDGEEHARVDTGQGRLNAVAFDRAARRVMTAGRSGTAVVRALDGKAISTIGARGEPWLQGADFDASGERVLTAGVDGIVRIAARDGSHRRTLFAAPTALAAIATAPHGKLAIAGDASGKVHVFLLG